MAIDNLPSQFAILHNTTSWMEKNFPSKQTDQATHTFISQRTWLLNYVMSEKSEKSEKSIKHTTPLYKHSTFSTLPQKSGSNQNHLHKREQNKRDI